MQLYGRTERTSPNEQTAVWAAHGLSRHPPVYAALFGSGKLIFGEIGLEILLLTVAVGCFSFIMRDLCKRDYSSLSA